MPPVQRRFEPTDYSRAELQFLLTNLTKPPVVIKEMALPPHVVRVQVLKVITDCYELQEMDRHKGIPWAGYEAVLDSIERTLAWLNTCDELTRQGGPRHPSTLAWDGDRYTQNGIGADSGLVRTEILPDGSRRQLGLDLAIAGGRRKRPGLVGAAPWIGGDGKETDLAVTTPAAVVLKENTKTGTGQFVCPICDHAETFKGGNQNSKQGARARMMRHLKSWKTQVDSHRLLYSRESGKGKAL